MDHDEAIRIAKNKKATPDQLSPLCGLNDEVGCLRVLPSVDLLPQIRRLDHLHCSIGPRADVLSVVLKRQLNRQIQRAVDQALNLFDNRGPQAYQIRYSSGGFATSGDHHHWRLNVNLRRTGCQRSCLGGGPYLYCNGVGQRIEVAAAIVDVLHGCGAGVVTLK